MKPDSIHHLNTGLILFSCIIAFIIPFELFLFSYSVLGPLHYLTEIGWLHRKNYFTKGKYDFIYLVGACFILIYWKYNPPKNYLLTADIIFISLFSSIGLVFIKDTFYRFVLLIMAIIFIVFFNSSSAFFIWIGIFLPTIIHVFIFTWAFMLLGAMKEKSLPGLISVFTLILCSVIILFFQPTNLNYTISLYIQNSYRDFTSLNFHLINYLKMDNLIDMKEVFTSNSGFVIMRFIAFAYTYHYLNWFSKTSVIKWHKIPKVTLVTTFFLWIISVLLYVYDYNLGLSALFFLSFLHVLLEFPLNIISFAGIGKALINYRKG